MDEAEKANEVQVFMKDKFGHGHIEPKSSAYREKQLRLRFGEIRKNKSFLRPKSANI